MSSCQLHSVPSLPVPQRATCVAKNSWDQAPIMCGRAASAMHSKSCTVATSAASTSLLRSRYQLKKHSAPSLPALQRDACSCKGVRPGKGRFCRCLLRHTFQRDFHHRSIHLLCCNIMAQQDADNEGKRGVMTLAYRAWRLLLALVRKH